MKAGPGLSRSTARLDGMSSYLGDCGRLAPMGKRQPLGQLARGLIRSRAVKRHHGGWYPRRAKQLGAPAVPDGHDLNKVRPSADSLFEVVKGHGAIFDIYGGGGTAAILRFGTSRSSEARREDGMHTAGDAKRRSIRPKKNFT